MRHLTECWSAWRVFSTPSNEWTKEMQDYYYWTFSDDEDNSE